MAIRRVNPLRSNVPITDAAGNPTPMFQRLWQSLFLNDNEIVTLDQLIAEIQTWEIVAGVGLAGGGPLQNSPVTIDLEDTAVTPGTYGDATNSAQITVDQQGRITAAANVPISGGGGGGAVVQIAKQVLGAPAATVTFATIPGTYSELRLAMYTRTDTGAGSDTLRVRFNADTGTNYFFARENRFGVTSGVAATYAELGAINANTAPANFFAQTELRLQAYAQATNKKNGRAQSTINLDLATASVPEDVGLFWNATAAISQIDLFAGGGGSFVAGSEFVLYGIT